MKKKFIAMCLTLLMSMSIVVVPSFAVDTDTEQSQAVEAFENSVEAVATLSEVDENGVVTSVTPVDVEVTTVEINAPHMIYADGANAKHYATIAKAKTKPKFGYKIQSKVTATITIQWIDNPGIRNGFESISGGWTYPSGQGISLSGRYVSLKGTGVQASEEGPVAKYRPSGNTFSYSGYENGWFSYTGYSKVVINSKENLVLTVRT